MKKGLTQSALAALMLASALPIVAQADQHSQELLLAAASCGAYHPTQGKREIADNSTGTNSYDANNNSYQMNSNSSYENISNTYNGTSTSPGNDSVSTPNRKNNDWNAAHSSNHSYSQTGTQYQSNANGYHSYNNAEEVDYNHATSAVSNTISEEQLVSSLNGETRKIYDNLSTQGKALAIQLASQDNYRDKNLAVKEAQKRTEKADVMVR
ncbi:hypothetical protein [Candidatus Protochlamydia sp. R18]|uniref:hypothetical protein n=1 Tax=Candidatus Protochlamydia sp. R18 TaxID=1353977 RepID=UPI0005A61128|nr:hypothetical protein [Candidatus Protochlamydia sp. R18]